MRFNVTAVPAAILAALCLSIPFVAQADDASTQPVAVQSVCGQGDHLFDIINTSSPITTNITTGVLHYRLTARASEYMPAFMTWNLPLFPLKPGQVFQVIVPRAAWGLKVTLEVFSDAAATHLLKDTKKTASYPNFCR